MSKNSLSEKSKLNLNKLVEANRLDLIKTFVSKGTRLGELLDVPFFIKRLKSCVTNDVGEVNESTNGKSLVEEFSLLPHDIQILGDAINIASNYLLMDSYEGGDSEKDFALMERITVLNEDLLKNLLNSSPTEKNLLELESIVSEMTE